MINKVIIFILIIFSTSSVLSCISIESVQIIKSCENMNSHKSIKPCCCETEHSFYTIQEVEKLTFSSKREKVAIPIPYIYNPKTVLYQSIFNSTFYLPLKKIRLLI